MGRYPTITKEASPNPNGLNPNVTVGRNSVGIVAPGDSGSRPYTQASPDPNGLNPNVPVGRNSVGIAAHGDSEP